MEAHNAAVAATAHRVRTFHDRKQAFRIFHGSTNSTWKPQYIKDNTVDISALTNVLQIDRERRRLWLSLMCQWTSW